MTEKVDDEKNETHQTHQNTPKHLKHTQTYTHTHTHTHTHQTRDNTPKHLSFRTQDACENSFETHAMHTEFEKQSHRNSNNDLTNGDQKLMRR